jgi:hypothetical protein
MVATACGGTSTSVVTVPVTMTLTLVAATPSEVTITWTQHVGASLYEVHRGGLIGGTASTSFTDELALRSDTTYHYQVRAIVTSGNPLSGPYERTVVGTSEFLAVHTPPTAPWQRETVASHASYPGVVVDGNGDPQVLYATFTGYELEMRLATDASGAWVSEPVALGRPWRLVRSAAGILHVSYDEDRSPRHARRDGTDWTTEAIDVDRLENDIFGGDPGVALAMDASGNLHAAYVVEAAGLRHATNAGGAWTSQQIGNDPDVVEYDLAIGPDGSVHVLYFTEGAPRPLRHVTNATGTWETGVVAADSPGGGVACAFDGSGTLHAVAHAGFDLVHFNLSLTGWAAETVHASAGGPLGDVSLAIGEGGALHVAYSGGDADLLYATNAGGAWSTLYIDADGTVGQRNSLAIGGGRVHIAYTDVSQDAVKHARSP